MTSLPNLITIGRIALIPLIILLMYIREPWAAWTALAFYTLAAVTDFLDGYLARRMDDVSDIGKFLDPIADKIMVGSLLVALAAIDRLAGIWVIPAIIILVREFLVAGLREYLGPKNITLPVSNLAKWKTGLQMVALGFLVVGPYGEWLVRGTLIIGQIGLTIAAILTVMTGWTYMKTGVVHMLEASRAKQREKEQGASADV
ncbi:MAG: CDP-diacylglycerol--glycerol-3-phosphate 3-phosphatidyltransferase [Pseudobdellovibrionaceae bacterium]